VSYQRRKCNDLIGCVGDPRALQLLAEDQGSSRFGTRGTSASRTTHPAEITCHLAWRNSTHWHATARAVSIEAATKTLLAQAATCLPPRTQTNRPIRQLRTNTRRCPGAELVPLRNRKVKHEDGFPDWLPQEPVSSRGIATGSVDECQPLDFSSSLRKALCEPDHGDDGILDVLLTGLVQFPGPIPMALGSSCPANFAKISPLQAKYSSSVRVCSASAMALLDRFGFVARKVAGGRESCRRLAASCRWPASSSSLKNASWQVHDRSGDPAPRRNRDHRDDRSALLPA
jgi:hypothetical protein